MHEFFHHQAALAVNPMWEGEDGKTPLHFAAKKGNTRMLARLLKAGADPNKEDEDEVRPLHTAAEHNRSRAVKLLLEAGADVDAENGLGRWTALDIAEESGFNRVVKLLREREASAT